MAVRADAQRNRDALLDRAAGMLAEEPEASVHEIAAAAGLTRATAYRHFPSREALIAAIHERVEGEALELVVEAVALRSPPEVLARLSESIVSLADRYRFLAGQPQKDTSGSPGEAEMTAWLSSARRRGEVDSSIPVEWQQAMLRGMTIAACEEVAADRATPSQASTRLAAALLRLLAA